ncbi:hypothetical protein V5N11_026319 [Cardamine amara subsp. amara]|uniref:Reverse transcriptase zinc-binding domain-containing protein n=1 Tax=Cardamine amara subsp. amara TaxID=228776 RepID=A0ABD0Z034_CARAN
MLKGENFWTAEVKSSSSWLWNSLLKLRPLARQFITCSVGDGKLASFWFDSWCSLGPLIGCLGHQGPSALGISRTATVAESLRGTEWRLPPQRSRLKGIEDLRNCLNQTQTPSEDRGSDSFHWKVGDREENKFSASRTWESLRPRDVEVPWSETVWFKGNVPKHAFTFWVSSLDRLPVRERLHRWGIAPSPNCCTCDRLPETRDHLFLHCDFSSQIWNQSLSRLGLSNFLFADWSCLLSWLSTSSPHIPKKLKRLVAQATVFMIWRERNTRLHTSSSATAAEINKAIDRSIRDTLLARRKRKGFGKLLSLWFSYA